MKWGDLVLQKWRYKKAAPYVQESLLDIGCYDGSFIDYTKVQMSLGIDKESPVSRDNVKKAALADFWPTQKFSTISALATYEHFNREERVHFWKLAKEATTPGSNVVMTIPHPFVDVILKMLKIVGVLDGMDEQSHTDVSVNELVKIAKSNGFKLGTYKKFQIGLNQLFVFVRESHS